MKLDLETAIEDLMLNPTADVASRARQSLDSVTRMSKNLKGGCIKKLKQAAVLSTAALEVLRTWADNKSNSDVPRQIRALKEELEKTKEAMEAKEEAEKLRKKLEVIKVRKKRPGRTAHSGSKSILAGQK